MTSTTSDAGNAGPRDAVLVASARRGDIAAFEVLVGRHLDAGHRIATALLGASDGEAAVLDASLAAWRHLPRLDDASEFGPWFDSVLVGACRMRGRGPGAGRSPGTLRPPAAPRPPDAPAADGDGVEAALGRLDQAFEQLDVADRTALVLHEVAGRPAAQIAGAIHEPVGVIRVRLAEAVAALLEAQDGRVVVGPKPSLERIREMLERRAAPPSPGLRDRIAAGAARTPQDRSGPRLDRIGALLVTAVLVGVAATGGYLAGRQGRMAAATQADAGQSSGPGSGAGSGSVAPGGPTPTGGVPDPSAGSPLSSAAAPSPPAPPTAPPTLTVGGLAVVTAEGDRLRVRTQPGVADPGTRLQPLLPSGARMLILRGPLALDNHDWYQVSIDRAPGFGWVAANGDGVPWLAPAAPLCTGSRSPAEAWTMPRMDLLACYGSQPFTVEVVGMSAGPATACADATGRSGCAPSPRWLMEPQAVTVLGEDGQTASLTLAMPDSARPVLGASSPSAPVAVMIGLDHAAAQACRVVDSAGLDVIPRDAAVATCRLTFVVLAVAR